MGTKTSVYLSDDLLARWRASSLPLSDLIRRGLDTIDAARSAPDLETVLRRVMPELLAGLTVADAGHQRPAYASPGYDSEPFEEIP